MRTLKNIGSFHIKTQPQDAEKISHQLGVTSTYQEDCTVFNRRHRTCSIWDLPESVLVCILRGLHIRDLLSFRLTSSYFCSVIDNNGSLWASVSFAAAWPSEHTNQQFVKAARRRNLEAVVKLAVAYLYTEELSRDDITTASKEAAQYLCQAERLTPKTFPFFWIFIRPPWSSEGSCCKLQTFQRIKEMSDKIGLPDVTFGTALILKLQRLALHGDLNAEEEKYFTMAVNQKSPAAEFFSLMDAIAVNEQDKGKELEKVRLLRQIASNDILEAKLNLIRYYTQGLYGGISKEKAEEYVREFFMCSKPSGIHIIFSGSHTSDISRYILIDWLVEVVGMKDFSAHVLYFAVSLFDRFLQIRKIQRSQVQLLGVAAIVVSSRFLGFEILTIREAAWLTDNSYTYYDVVKMMGELVATLRGNLRALTVQDYTKVLLSIVNETGCAGVLTEYISMLCLLQSEMGQYSPAEIAASCLLLSRILLNHADVWPTVLKDWTGFSQDYLSLCTFHIYNKCLLEGSEMEYRDTTLQAVKTRYADPLRYSVSNTKLIGHKELCRRLGVTKLVTHGKDTKAIKFRNTDELIMSPHLGLRPDYHRSIDEGLVNRDNAATPMNNEFVSEEGFSGYEGDLEYESDESCDKSEVLCEDMDMSTIADVTEDSKHWYSCSEDNLADDSQDDAESIIQDMSDLQCDKTSENDQSSKITCLSSMCQSGANLACHASRSLPSSCISNCSCKKSYSSTVTMNSGLSLSSPSLLCPSSDSSSSSISLPSLNHGNVRTCLPCGSINSASKGPRRNRLDACSNSCDILAHNKQVCDGIPCPSYYDERTLGSEFYFLRKAQSSQDLRTLTNHTVDKNIGGSIDFSLSSNQSDVKSLSAEKSSCLDMKEDTTYQTSVLTFTEDTTYHVNIVNDIQCLDNDTRFSLKCSKEHSLNNSQGSSCNNSSSVYTSSDTQSHGSNDIHITSESSSMSQDLHTNQNLQLPRLDMEYSTQCRDSSFSYSSLIQSNNDNQTAFTSRKDATQLDSFTFDNLPNHHLHLTIMNKHDIVHMPATPESVLDIQKFSSRASSLVRGRDSFIDTSFNDANTSRLTSKRARLEYSGSLSSSVDFALKQLDLSFESNKCDKSEVCTLPHCISVTLVDDCACDASSKLNLKRKCCQ